ncbi:MAG: nucleotidyltransferase family protein [Phycisphaeraceae bacterium]
MRRDQALNILRDHADELHRRGVRSLLLYGSLARDQATPHSDVDLLVELDQPTGMLGLVALQQHIEHLLGCRVDLVTQGGLRPHVREHVMKEAIRAA